MRRLRVLFLVLSAALALACWAWNAAHVGQETPDPDDTAITNAVQSKLFEEPAWKAREIHVTSQNGVVALTGAVNSNIERLAVERFANQASGVTQVIDQLVVSAPPIAQTAATAPPVKPIELPQPRIKSARRPANAAGTEVANPMPPTSHATPSGASSPASTPPKPAEVVPVTPPLPPPPPP